jgi:hypothetical protein
VTRATPSGPATLGPQSVVQRFDAAPAPTSPGDDSTVPRGPASAEPSPTTTPLVELAESALRPPDPDIEPVPPLAPSTAPLTVQPRTVDEPTGPGPARRFASAVAYAQRTLGTSAATLVEGPAGPPPSHPLPVARTPAVQRDAAQPLTPTPAPPATPTPIQSASATEPVASTLSDPEGPAVAAEPWVDSLASAPTSSPPASPAPPASTPGVRLGATIPLQRTAAHHAEVAPSGYAEPTPLVVSRPAAPRGSADDHPGGGVPFASMFGVSGHSATGSAVEDGFTSVQLDAADAAPMPSEPPAESPAPAVSPAPAPPTGAAPTDLDEMARRLYEPLSARLRAELWLDRERAGVMSDV